MIAGVDVVLAPQEMDVVGERIVPSAEGGLAERGDCEVARHLNLGDLLKRRLVYTGDAKVSHADSAGNRPAAVVLDLVADDEVIDDVRSEGVRFGDQRVVIVVRSPVGKGENVRGVFQALQDERVGEVALKYFVSRGQFLVCTRRDLRHREVVRECERSNGAVGGQRGDVTKEFLRHGAHGRRLPGVRTGVNGSSAWR